MSDVPSAPRGRDDASGMVVHWNRVAILAIGAVVGVLLLLFLVAATTSKGKIASGTTVQGVDIGGKTPDEAKALLIAKLGARAKQPLIATVDGATTKATVNPVTAGLSFDAAATVARAESGGNPFQRVSSMFGSSKSIDPVVVVSDAKLNAAVKKATKKLDRKMRNGAVKFENGEAVAVSPVVGHVVDPAATKATLAAALLDSSRTVVVKSTTAQPVIDAKAVEDAMKGPAASAVSAPVTVHATGTKLDGTAIDVSSAVPVSVFARHLSMKINADKELVTVVDSKGLRAALSDRLGGIEQPAVDATFKIVGGKPVVVASQAGREIDADDLGTAFTGALGRDGADRVAAVAVTTSTPELTTAQARALGVTEKISSFRQKFPYAPYRYQNIGAAAGYINGTLLKPGDTFSMNGTVKERTVENGYTQGYVIQDGRLREDLGGGVSTITTAVWHAAFYAGLERVEQRAHSLYISRYLPGLEATVAWGSLDLKFRNDSPNGVFITANRGTNGVTVTMYGTKRYDIDAAFGPRTNVKPFKTLVDTKPGCVKQDGADGFSIVVTRIFKQNGVEVKREPLKSRYVKEDRVTCTNPGNKVDAG